MKRTVFGVLATAVVVLLAGCGSNDSAGSSSSAAATTSAATSSSSKASSAMSSADMSSSVMVTPTGPTISAGGSSTELDAQSTTWFTTLCGGLTSISDLTATKAATPAEAGQLLTQAGTDITTTGQALAAAPPPTFEGGAELATNVVTALNELGPSFTALGQKAATIPQGDTAAAQQFAAEFEQELAPLAQLNQVDVTPETQQAIAKIPACTPIFAAQSTAPETS